MTRRQFFKNAQWKVTCYGLECRTTHYDIQAKTLCHVRGELPEWPLHMADKNWVDARLFCEAFREAIALHGITFDAMALDRSCTRAIAQSDYNALHSAAFNRIAKELNIGNIAGTTARIYDCRELFQLCDLADAELAAKGIYSPRKEQALA